MKTPSRNTLTDGNCVCWLASRVPGMCSRVFISRLRDNYTQWGGSGVRVKGAVWVERGDPDSGASGLMVGGWKEEGTRREGEVEVWR